MATHDYSLANQTPASYRTDHNNLNQAVGTNNYSTSSLATTMACMPFADATSSGWLRLRDTADSTWYYLEKLNAQGGLCTYAGNPSTNHIGRYVGQPLWDTSNNVLYLCTLAGTSSQATWSRAMYSTESQGFPAKYIGGPAPTYTSVTSVTIPGGFCCRDDSTSADISISTDYVVDITVSGAGGLSTTLTESTGTWYHVYAIRKSTDGTVNFILTATTSGGTFPSGYDQKRYLFPVRNSSAGDFLPFYLSEWGNSLPRIMYQTNFSNYAAAGETNIVNANISTSFTTYSAASFIPTNGVIGIFNSVSTGINIFGQIRETGSTFNGTPTNPVATPYMEIPVSTSQQIDVRELVNVAGTFRLDVTGYTYTIY